MSFSSKINRKIQEYNI